MKISYLYLVREILTYFLIAVLITFVRLSSDNEIVAFKASGVSLYQLTPPILFLSVMAYLLTTFLVIYALPWGNNRFKYVLYDIAKTKAYTALKERAFNDSFDGIVIYVDKTPLRGKKLERIFIHSEDKGSEGEGERAKQS